MMNKRIFFLGVLLLMCSCIFSQDEKQTGNQKDSTSSTTKFYTSSNPKPSGIFFAPVLGVDFPMNEFSSNSKYSVSFGFKLEYASISIYPIVLFGEFYSQKHQGSDAFKTLNVLNSAETKVTSIGGGIYILLNKYLKSNFTMPFLVADAKMYNIKRTISPEVPIEGIKLSDSKVVFSAGFGFTLFIFDIITSYNFAKEYSALTFKTQFRLPLIKF